VYIHFSSSFTVCIVHNCELNFSLDNLDQSVITDICRCDAAVEHDCISTKNGKMKDSYDSYKETDDMFGTQHKDKTHR